MRNLYAMLTDGIADFLAFPPQAGVFRAVQLWIAWRGKASHES
jgi:hypothetical protein